MTSLLVKGLEMWFKIQQESLKKYQPAAGVSEDDTVKLGSIVSGNAERVTPHAIIVNVDVKGYNKGMISSEHLAGNHGLASMMESVLKPGCKFEKLLLEMVHSKRLNVQKFHLGGTRRKVLYHSESKLLVVLRTYLSDDSCSSDICCVDPLSGLISSSVKLEPGETGKCMELLKAGNEQVLVVGTSLSTGPAIMPTGEAESTKGKLIVLCLEHKQNLDSGSMTFYSKRNSPFCDSGGGGSEQLSSSSLCSSPDDIDSNSCDGNGIKLEETEEWNLRLAYATNMRGIVLALCPYLDCYFLASAGSSFYVCSFQNDSSLRVKRLAGGKTWFMIMTLTTHFTTIIVGDCRDGILFYAYYEKVEQLYSDPVQRLVADWLLMNIDTAVVSDHKGSIAVLSCSHHSTENGSFSYKLLADDEMRGD
ncbi:hypothetical protein Lser_V15G20005 [Lactuca serriola]